MSSQKKEEGMEDRTGGPAFPFDQKDFQPTTGEQVVREQFSGMTLRDYFAGQYLVGLEASGRTLRMTQDEVAIECFQQADAMLKRREV